MIPVDTFFNQNELKKYLLNSFSIFISDFYTVEQDLSFDFNNDQKQDHLFILKSSNSICYDDTMNKLNCNLFILIEAQKKGKFKLNKIYNHLISNTSQNILYEKFEIEHNKLVFVRDFGGMSKILTRVYISYKSKCMLVDSITINYYGTEQNNHKNFNFLGKELKVDNISSKYLDSLM